MAQTAEIFKPRSSRANRFTWYKARYLHSDRHTYFKLDNRGNVIIYPGFGQSAMITNKAEAGKVIASLRTKDGHLIPASGNNQSKITENYFFLVLKNPPQPKG